MALISEDEYFAGLVSDGELEERVTGLPVIEVGWGTMCADQTARIGRRTPPRSARSSHRWPQEHEADPSRPRDGVLPQLTELHLLLPVRLKP